MATQSIEVLIEGGKATAAPPLGPALGPLGVNIGEIVNEINSKTKNLMGMQVPVKVEVDSETKKFNISIGTPAVSSLILKEANIQKGSGRPQDEKVADVAIEQIIKVAKIKEKSLLGKDLKNKVKEVMGSCDSMGVLVEGLPARETIQKVNEGKFDKEIEEERTEISEEKKRTLESKKKEMQAELEKHHKEEKEKAEAIIKKMAGKERSDIKHALEEEGIPSELINQLLPAEGAVAEGASAGGVKEEKAEEPAKEKAEPKEEK
ncbi:50S ribosomal protein L11 [Candidatus Woesearchaeota archaeon]|nr:50S ribosomal protein L11 [Candidatus Woesearchaeota archaeon]